MHLSQPRFAFSQHSSWSAPVAALILRLAILSGSTALADPASPKIPANPPIPGNPALPAIPGGPALPSAPAFPSGPRGLAPSAFNTPAPMTTGGATPAPALPIFVIGGAVRSPQVLKAKDLADMTRTTITAKEKSGADVAYEGVELSELLKRAGAPIGEELRGPALQLAVVITAADNYHAVFALAELDPAMTDKKVLLADTADGKPLPPETGPFRLIVPDEKRHARWVRQVTRLDVVRVDPTAVLPNLPALPGLPSIPSLQNLPFLQSAPSTPPKPSTPPPLNPFPKRPLE